MHIETIKESYPGLFSRLPDDIYDMRSLIVIDENEHDDEVDELEDIDSADYNTILYLTEKLQQAVGDEKDMIELIKRLDSVEEFDDFFPSEVDLYGVQTSLDEDAIAKVILDTIEEMLS